MDIFDKAKELGNMIAQSDKMKRMHDAENALENSIEAKDMIEKYKQLQLSVVRASKAGAQKQEVDALKEELVMHQQKLNENSITNDYLQSKIDFERFTKNINQVILFAITGEEGCSPDKCGSCSSNCK